jgi:hypothetical protein
VQVRGGHAAAAKATVDAISAGGYVAQNDYDRRSESTLHRVQGEIALADGRAAEALRHCQRSRDEADRYYPEGHAARVQARACEALATWTLRKDAASRDGLQALQPALAAAGRLGAYWQRQVDAALAGGAR